MWVKGVPGQIHYSCPILQCGQCRVRQAAWLLQLGEEAHPTARQSQAREPAPGKQVPGPAFHNRTTDTPTAGWPKLSALDNLCPAPSAHYEAPEVRA